MKKGTRKIQQIMKLRLKCQHERVIKTPKDYTRKIKHKKPVEDPTGLVD